MEALQRFGCYDQLKHLGSSAGLKTLVRRALIVIEAHDRPGERPNFDLAPYLAGAAAQPRNLGKRSRAPRLEQRQKEAEVVVVDEVKELEGEDVAGVVGRPGLAPAPRQAMSKPLRVGGEATDAPRRLAYSETRADTRSYRGPYRSKDSAQ